MAWVRAGGELQLAIGLPRVHDRIDIVNTEISKMSTNRRPRGRPSKQVQDRLFQMRVSEQFFRTIDDWRRAQSDLPSRAEAVRRMVELAAKPKKKQDSDH